MKIFYNFFAISRASYNTHVVYVTNEIAAARALLNANGIDAAKDRLLPRLDRGPKLRIGDVILRVNAQPRFVGKKVGCDVTVGCSAILRIVAQVAQLVSG